MTRSFRVALFLVLVSSGLAPAWGQSSTTKKSTAGSSSAVNPATGGGTKSELDALIDKQGKTPPSWYDATKLNYPTTLDLSFPDKPQGGWNNQKNVGQFVWDVINPNPGRWREGVKLMHHLLTTHQKDPVKREKIMLILANMYHNLLEDYARAAFWYRAAGVEKDPDEYAVSAVILAECYWRLGFTTQARTLLTKVPGGMTHAKLLGDMGETDRCVRMCQAVADSQGYALLTAGDACRQVGRYPEALRYYQMVIDLPVPAKNPPSRLTQNIRRAKSNVEAIKSFELLDLKQVADGSYAGAAQGYEGAVEVSVTVQKGRIELVSVVKHREKQFYSAMTDTPAKIIAKQHVKGVDSTSNATITSEAIINATAKALTKK